MPKHHQSAGSSGRHSDRHSKNQQQQQHRRRPVKVAPQQVPQEPVSDDDVDGSGVKGLDVVPYGVKFDALLQESAFRQLGQQRPQQQQQQQLGLVTASASARAERHPLWPDPNLLGAALALAMSSDCSEGSESGFKASKEAAVANYLKLFGFKTLPSCLPETAPSSDDDGDADSVTSSDDDFDSNSESETEDENSETFSCIREREFNWLDTDCVAVKDVEFNQLKVSSIASVANPTLSAEMDAASPLEPLSPQPQQTPPLLLPPPPPPLPPLPDARPPVRQTRALSELDDDLDRLLMED